MSQSSSPSTDAKSPVKEEKKEKRSSSIYSIFSIGRKTRIPLDALKEDSDSTERSRGESDAGLSSSQTNLVDSSPAPASPTAESSFAEPASPRGESSVTDTAERNELRKWKRHYSLQQSKDTPRPTIMQIMSSQEEGEATEPKTDLPKHGESFISAKPRDRSSTAIVLDVIEESKFKSRRDRIALELYKTECTYVASLDTLITCFIKPLRQLASDSKQTDVTTRDIQDIFSNVEAIHQLNESFRDKLHERLVKWSSEAMIGDIFVKMGPYLKIYTQYINNYDNAINTLRRQLDRRDMFFDLVETYQKNPKCCGLNLHSFLIMPVQRIPRYVLLLQELYSNTEATHADYQGLVDASTKVKEIADIVNEKIREDENTRKFFSIQHKLVGFEHLVQPHRRFLHEIKIGVGLRPSRSPTTFFLFSDILVSTTSLAGYLHCDEILDLQALWIVPVPSEPLRIDLVTPEKTINLCGANAEEKQATFTMLSSSLDEYLTKSSLISGGIRKGSFTSPTFGSYKGEWDVGRIHGQGTFQYLNNNIYEGQFYQGKRQGTGKFTSVQPDSYTIDGEWADDRVHGQAKLITRSKMEYHGSWVQGAREGRGQLIYPDGSICYDGYFSQGLFHGKGRLSLKNASYYDGDWVLGKRHGIGAHSNEAGLYSGEWANDVKEGHGMMKYANGDSFEGVFKDDQPNGRGTLKTKTGFTYTGIIVGNRVDGNGKITYPNGDEYAGDIKDGRRHGTGTLTTSLGVYTGSFLGDRKEGNGRFSYRNGDVYEGTWKDDKKNGQGAFTWANGSQYTGGYIFDKKDGKGMLTMRLSHASDGYEWQYDGYFKDDKKHGPGMLYFQGGARFEGSFSHDVRDGKGLFYNPTGESTPQYWKDGVMIRTQNQYAITEVETFHRFC